jgi:hypothetical protein
MNAALRPVPEKRDQIDLKTSVTITEQGSSHVPCVEFCVVDEDQLLDLATLATSMTLTADVGFAIQAALARGEAHRVMCQKKLRVRLFNSPTGLTIVVTVPARENVELEASDCGRRVIPWSDLSRRAHQLSDIVDDCVIELEAALGLGAARA